jgi:hypothetical protein
MKIINHKGKIYVFPKNTDTDCDKMYTDRLWFIVKNSDKGSLDYITNMSYIWMNNKYYNLEYEPHIMSALSELNSI